MCHTTREHTHPQTHTLSLCARFSIVKSSMKWNNRSAGNENVDAGEERIAHRIEGTIRADVLSYC